ncbi:hypothetical protein BN988_02900 [Oceanobacillus picturae]|uniref:Uncharacterized protein n=1 Tax=Oceanobacillus picturae TaxID=171693 RepID=W9ANX3_9BACI|nr:SDR family oxidoreductase [Oceanobacillus picturae]CDO04346.1 hypothetical protein BN988_02900 [Oceanobacillus picturae]
MKIQTLGTRGLAWSISSATKSDDYPRSPHFKQPIRVGSGGSSSQDLVILITGVNRGQGKAIAEHLADLGGNVIVLYYLLQGIPVRFRVNKGF